MDDKNFHWWHRYRAVNGYSIYGDRGEAGFDDFTGTPGVEYTYTMQQFDAVSLKILWDRLVSISDEIVSTLVRTSFSINTREGYDLSCVLFEAGGRWRYLAPGGRRTR